MNKSRFTINAFAVVLVGLAFVTVAQAQATRTWVSGVGDDVNPCSRTAPCKTFAGAISKTATGGEISVLDPGGYGTLTITKAITVDGGTGAGWGSTLASSVNGFIINITTNLTTDRVILRNLSINGAGTTLGVDGIRFLDGAELTVENVSIFNFSGDGIEIAQSQNSTTHIRNVTINNVPTGIKVNTTAGQTAVTVEDSSIRATTVGFDAIANVRASVRNSTFDRGSTCFRTSGGASIVNADDLWISGCTTGVQASLNSTINIGDSMIVQNVTGLSLNTGTINSMSGNTLFSNTAPGAFSFTQAKQ
jgi:hypothetical protein